MPPDNQAVAGHAVAGPAITRPAPGGGGRSLLVLLVGSTGCAMTVLDTNIVAIVLPTIARDLGASFAEIEWVVSAYVLCFASLLLPAGAIADRFGRRRVFLCGIAVFAATSLLCGLSPTAPALFAARALQGVGAAFLLAPALAIIGHAFHEEAERSRAWAIWGGIMGLAMVLSPILGGVIAHQLGWRWAFHINLPICLLLAGAARLAVGESRDAGARRLDPLGILFFAGAMFGFTSALIGGQEHGWGTAGTLFRFACGAASLLAFIAVETRQRRPMLDLTLFRLPKFIGAVSAMFAYAACAQVMASLLPLFLQNGLGHSPLQAGVSMLPFALAMLILPQVGRLLGRYLPGPRLLVLGLAVVGAGNALTAFGALQGGWGTVAAGMAILGAGGGLLNGETQKAIMGSVPPDRSGMASGISTTARFSGILMGFAVLSGVLATVARSSLSAGACGPGGAACGEAGAFADAVVAGDLPRLLAGMAPDVREVAAASAHQAYSTGFSAALATAAGVAILAAVAVRLLMRDGGR